MKKETEKCKKSVIQEPKSCGGYGPQKGHLDTQLFPECKDTIFDRDIVKKNTKRKKKTSTNCNWYEIFKKGKI